MSDYPAMWYALEEKAIHNNIMNHLSGDGPRKTGGIWALTDEENVWIKHPYYGWSRDYKPYSRRVRNAKLKKLLL